MAAAIVISVFGNLIIASGRPIFSVANYFSYFTILSNIAAAALLGYQAVRGATAPALYRGAITLYMTITGIVDNVLLMGVDVLTPPWVDLIVHITGPIVVLVDWITDPPGEEIRPSMVLSWLVFPLIYITYTLTRGQMIGWYPYPFLDPAEVGGYAGVLAYALAITAAFVLVGFALRSIAQRRRRSLKVRV